MAHDHAGAGHHHGHAHPPPSNDRAFAVGVALNLGFVGVEIAYGIAANSLALLSDAAHNAGDVFGLLIAWAAVHLGKSMPTKRRTYGLRRSSILAAVVNAVVLLLAVGGIAWEALGRIAHPEAVQSVTVMVVAGIGVVINSASAMMFMAGRKADLNVRGAFLHMTTDALVSLAVVLAGVGIYATGWIWLDPAISLLVCVPIVWGTWNLLRESLSLALDAVPAGIDAHAVESHLAGLPGVCAVHDLHIWAMSTTETALTVHLVMPVPPADGRFLGSVSSDLQQRFKICHCTIQIEHGDVACHQAPVDVV